MLLRWQPGYKDIRMPGCLAAWIVGWQDVGMPEERCDAVVSPHSYHHRSGSGRICSVAVDASPQDFYGSANADRLLR